jgi:hypothetical protein
MCTSPREKESAISRKWRSGYWAGKNKRCPQQYMTELRFMPKPLQHPLLLTIFLPSPSMGKIISVEQNEINI